MQSFAYAAPETVQQALDVLAEHQGAGRRAQVMAGGTDLMVQMRLVDGAPRTIVDISRRSLKRIGSTSAPKRSTSAPPSPVPC